jgi:hypothetical protein
MEVFMANPLKKCRGAIIEVVGDAQGAYRAGSGAL